MEERPPAARSKDTREAFLRATGKLLRRQGYSASGLNQIVAESGAPKGSLYFHFPGGKEDLAVAAMGREGARQRAAMAGVLGPGEDPGAAIARLIDAMSAGLERSGFRDGCPIATVALEASSRSPAVRETAAAVFESWLEVIERCMLAAGLDRDTARRRALLALAAIEGALILARSRRDTEPLRAVREELGRLLG